MKLPIKKKTGFFLVLFIIIYSLLIAVILSFTSKKNPPIVQINSSQTHVVQAALVGHTSVASKTLAAKLDLERKVIIPSSASSVSKITSIVTQHGGTVEKKGNEAIVVHMPKDQQELITKQLQLSNSVEAVGTDYPVAVTADTEDWGVQKIEAPEVWPITQAAGVKVAVIDTGIDYNHPDLKGRYAGGYDTLNEDADPFDDNGHGTHVSGIIADSNGNGGYVGVAPAVQVLAVKALAADGTGYISDVVEAVDWAIQHGAQVINFSLGSPYNSSVLEQKLNEAAAKGIILVAAAGNTNGGSLTYPAAYSSVISVAATDRNDNLASFSSVGAEVAAPGVSITSAVPGGGYATWSGTSMASPHVAATAALMIANKQTNIRENLQKTAIDLGTSGVDGQFGYGLIDVKPAVLGEDTQAPLVTILSPEDNAVVNGSVNVVISAQDEHEVKNTKLFINNALITEWTATPSAYVWDTSGLEDGAYVLRVESTDEFENVGDAKVTVTVSKSVVTATPSSPTVPATASPRLNQGKSNENRQDMIQENANEHRQNYQTTSQENIGNTQSSVESVPDVTNMNQRNQRKAESFEQTQTNEHGNGRNVKGASTVSWLGQIVLWFESIL